jgi:YVTN family beta-propeller protein
MLYGIALCFVLLAASLHPTPAHAQVCRNDGDVNQDGRVTPVDALLAFQHVLGLTSLGACQQEQANASDPETSGITPADAQCILRRFLTVSSCLDFTGRRLIEVSGNNQVGTPGEVLPQPLVVRVEDQFGTPQAGVPVTFSQLVGDGTFAQSGPLRLPPGTRTPAQTVPANESIMVLTGANGTASVLYTPGQTALQIIAVQAQDVPNQVIFRVTLGPLAGNGTEPLNITVGGGRGYTVNGGTNNISVFDATRQTRDVLAVIDFQFLQTPFGAGGVSGVAVNAAANRLYVYGGVAEGTGGSIVLLMVDTTTNTPVEPIDPDGDARPGLTLFTTPAPSSPTSIALAPGQILGLDFGNLVAVDEGRRRVYAVVPGAVEVVEENGEIVSATIVNGDLIVIEDRDNAPAIVARIGVGEVPTGVAVNTRTNRVYVTNRGLIVNDAANDTMTVIDGSTFTVIDTVTVGRSPLGVTLDEEHNIIYVSNLFGAEALESAGAVSVINGETNTVIQTIETAGTTDLAVLIGAESALLDAAIDRLYINGGTGAVIDCDITTLTTPAPCQGQPDLSVPQGKLAINDSNTLLFAASRFDNAVTVFDLATNAVVEQINTGVSVGGVAVDPQTGTTYVSDFLGDELFVVDPDGALETFRLFDLARFEAPGQVEVDATNNRIYILSTASLPLIALDRANPAMLAATLEAEEGVPTPLNTLALDETRNLLYLTASSRGEEPGRTLINRLLVLDGAQLQGNTPVSMALLTQAIIGLEEIGSANEEEFVQGLAVDTARNLIYVARCSLFIGGCDPSRNALVVLRGAELDTTARTLLRAPQVVTTIPNIGLNFGGGHHDIALDMERNLIYVTGTFADVGKTLTGITVIDGFKIVDEQGQVTTNPAGAILGIIPITMLGDLRIPSIAGFTSVDMAFNAAKDLLYVVSASNAFFSEGFISVINSNAVIDVNAGRNFITTPHPTEPATLLSLIATIPAGIDPEFIAVDSARNHVVVSNQSRGALLVLQGLLAP